MKKEIFLPSVITGMSLLSLNNLQAIENQVIGCLDSLNVSGSTLTVTGWAYDVGGSTRTVTIQVYCDSSLIASIQADQVRDDVCSVFHITGNHGFSSKLETNLSGTHTIEVYALDLSKSTRVLLGKKEIQFTNNSYLPVGSVDHFSINGTTLKISGWAVDQDNYNIPIKVLVYAENQLLKEINTSTYRKDVCDFFGIAGNFGFTDTIDTNLSGEHTISVYAVDLNGKDRTLLSSRKVSLASNINRTAIGSVDHIAANGSTIKLSGWALDRDSLNDKLTIEVYANSQLIGSLKTGEVRSDVNKYFGLKGNYGYSGQINTSLVGAQQVSVYVVDPQNNNRVLIGSSTLTFTSPAQNVAPIGCLDSVKVVNQAISLQGWTFDKDASNQSIGIQIYLDKEYVGSLNANQIRSDVNQAYNITGNHGFNGTINTSLLGSKVLSVYAIDYNTNTKVLIGQKNIILNTISTGGTSSSMVGWIDFVSSPAIGVIEVQGWCYDSKNTGSVTSVRIYIDDQYVGSLSTTYSRTDVNQVYNISGFHGFYGSINTTLTGTHTVKIYGVTSNGNNMKLLGTKSIEIAKKDIVSVAYTQLGINDGSKYNSWYGIANSSAWCATFVSWCADQAGVLNTKTVKFSWCGTGVSWFKNRNLWLKAGSTPKRGYLIFFDYQQDGLIDHVGIVEKVINGIIYTIEGNNNNQVRRATYSKDNSSIYGYGIIE